MEKSKVGKIAWHDLTITDADSVSKFYEEVGRLKKGTCQHGKLQ